MRQCKPHLHAIPDEEFAKDFVRKLTPKIAGHVNSRWTATPVCDWYAQLNRFAKDADVVYDHGRRDAVTDGRRHPIGSMAAAPAARASAASSSSAAAPAARTPKPSASGPTAAPKAATTYFCQHHGANRSHNTENCNVLHGKRGSALVTAGGPAAPDALLSGLIGRFVEQLGLQGYAAAATSSAAPSGSAGATTKYQAEADKRNARGGGSRGAGGGGGAGGSGGASGNRGAGGGGDASRTGQERERCDYCRLPHWGVCFVKYPHRAPPGYQPRSEALLDLFNYNLSRQPLPDNRAGNNAQLAAGNVKNAAAAVTSYDDDEERLYHACITGLLNDSAASSSSASAGSPAAASPAVASNGRPWFLFDQPRGLAAAAEPERLPNGALPSGALDSACATSLTSDVAAARSPAVAAPSVASRTSAASSPAIAAPSAASSCRVGLLARRLRGLAAAAEPGRLQGGSSSSGGDGGSLCSPVRPVMSRVLRRSLLPSACVTGLSDAAHDSGAAQDCGRGGSQPQSLASLATLKQQPAPVGFQPAPSGAALVRAATSAPLMPSPAALEVGHLLQAQIGKLKTQLFTIVPATVYEDILAESPQLQDYFSSEPQMFYCNKVAGYNNTALPPGWAFKTSQALGLAAVKGLTYL
ncbi:hypothetical protein HXX76_016147 [Chlamydomonas incerta]|uniref:Uncharacterized protein n=1 Tax=Chlamydomonas incerta TaxID=51695 RepID=A0A835SCQ7_CHLIN|nr:hypothetical protein HXX76_016147 [Chlamydomonas incerta]|eukprot:KAG2422297.1 hypothetical protein HXX76_016147 [Chlamydomonas incerta]